MPSQATPIPIVPAAQPAAATRGATTSQAAEGFEALVEDAKRDRQGVSNDASQADMAGPFVAELPVDATARPASGSVLDALASLASKPGDVTDGKVSVDETTADEAKADASKTADIEISRASVATVAQGVAEPAQGPVQGPTQDDVLTAAKPGSAQAEPDQTPVLTGDGEQVAAAQDPLVSAREARIAETLQRLNLSREGASAQPQTGPDAEVKTNPAGADAKAATAKADLTVEGKPGQAQIDAKAAEPAPRDIDLSARAETVTSDGDAGETDTLAALKDGRPASERAPGELIRNDMRAARAGAEAGVAKADAKSAAADVKSASTGAASPEIKAATQAVPTAQTQATQTGQAAPLELLLAQTAMAPLAEPALVEAPIDPALAKSDAAFDPAAARVEARADARIASTLQYAQGPRLTPQSAQTMAAQIAQRFNEGTRVFDIRMDPPELGRVEVRLEVGKDNSVRAILAAERTETLAELQRSARELERALTEAGLDVGEDALSFSLTDDSAFSDDAQADTGPETPVFVNDDAGLDALGGPLAPLSTYGFLLTRAEGLDVSV